jgi:hypothetical protein
VPSLGLLEFSTSSVCCSISPTSQLMNLKRWIVQTETT